MRHLRDFVLLTRLATGEHSDVFLALGGEGGEGGERAALKLFRGDLPPTFRHAVLEEASAAVGLEHPQIVRTLAVGEEKSELYLVRELVVGQTLASVLGRSSAPPSRGALLWILGLVADGLARAHRATAEGGPFLHLGLALGKILIGYDGEVKLLGIGQGSARGTIPLPASALPTASPEVLAGKPAGPESDAFSFGVLVHDALVGQRLFRRRTDAETRAAILRDPFPRPGERLALVEPDVAALIDRLVVRDPAHRSASLEDAAVTLLDASDRAKSGHAPELIAYLGEAFAKEKQAQARVIDGAIDRARRLLSGRDVPLRALRGQTVELPLDQLAPLADTHPRLEREGEEPPTDPKLDTDATPAIRNPPSEPTLALAPVTPPRGIHESDKAQVVPVPIVDRTQPIELPRPQPAAPPEPEASTGDVSLPPPQKIGRYEVEAEISANEHTTAYVGRDPHVGRTVALKVLDMRGDGNPYRLGVLQREARIAGRIHHPAVPTLLDAGRDGPLFYLVFRWVEGLTLTDALRRAGRLPSSEVARLFRGLVEVLGSLEAVQVTHGDVRPENILIGPGGVFLVDFSRASAPGEPEHPDRGADPRVLAPENLRGAPYDSISEQFVLGVLLYRLLTGREPFARREGTVEAAMVTELPEPPELVDAGADRGLSRVCMRLLEKEPELRYPSFAAIFAELTSDAPPPSPSLPPDDASFAGRYAAALVQALERSSALSERADGDFESPAKLAGRVAIGLGVGELAARHAELVVAFVGLVARVGGEPPYELIPPDVRRTYVEVERFASHRGASLLAEVAVAVLTYARAGRGEVGLSEVRFLAEDGRIGPAVVQVIADLASGRVEGAAAPTVLLLAGPEEAIELEVRLIQEGFRVERVFDVDEARAALDEQPLSAILLFGAAGLSPELAAEARARRIAVVVVAELGESPDGFEDAVVLPGSPMPDEVIDALRSAPTW